MRRSTKVQARMDWLLHQFVTFPHKGGMSAWDSDFVDTFTNQFPETEKSLIVYCIGPNRSPALNRTARALQSEGFLRAGVIDSDTVGRQFRTWARYWSVTKKGWLECKRRWPADVNRVVRTNCTTFAKIYSSAPNHA